jgi:hypothetical protein
MDRVMACSIVELQLTRYSDFCARHKAPLVNSQWIGGKVEGPNPTRLPMNRVPESGKLGAVPERLARGELNTVQVLQCWCDNENEEALQMR